MEEHLWQLLSGAAGIFVFAFTVFRYVAGIRDTLSTRMTTLNEAFIERIVNEREKTDLKIAAASAAEAQSRREFAAQILGALAATQTDIKEINRGLREMATRSDLTAMRNEMRDMLLPKS